MEENTFMMPEPVQEPAPVVRPPFFTFNINTILMLLLLVGLTVLYILFFTHQKTGGPVLSATAKGGSGLRVVFVNIDTLNQQYEFLSELKKNLEGYGSKLQNEVLSEQSGLQKEANDLQRLVSGNVVTQERANTIYQNLMQKQQALEEKKAAYAQEIAEKEYNMNMQLLDTVNSFLKRFNRSYQYDYIFGYKSAGEILIANDTLDITREVVGELNREYRAHKK